MLRSMGTSTRTWAATALMCFGPHVFGADLDALRLHDLRGSSVTLAELASDQEQADQGCRVGYQENSGSPNGADLEAGPGRLG